MAELTLLSDLSRHATQTQATPSSASRVSFTAAVQHVSPAKRMRMDRGGGGGSGAQPSRVASYHVVHVADPTTSYFKLLCWGDTLPVFEREDDHEGDDITAISVGDIVLFASCTVKSFRGNVEAQYTRHSSVKLLYRRDRYFNTRDVRLKDLYPMIEWYKQKRHAFLVVGDASASSPPERVVFTPTRDCREESLVNVRGTIHACKQSERPDAALRVQANSSEFHGVQLCEVMIQDTPTSTMVLNLWDQYADPRFVAKVLAYRGVVEVCGVVVSHNAVANRLLANTTPRTAFRFVDGNADAAESFSEVDAHAAQHERAFATVAALQQSSLRDGHVVVLQDVVIEHVLLDRFLGQSDRVDAAYAPLLVECYCTVCAQPLPVAAATMIPPLYASCSSRCRAKHGQSERAWRYRSVRMVLRDTAQGRLTVDVGDAVLTQLLGNIPAELLIHPQGPSSTVLPFDPCEMVAALMNHLVRGGPEPQLYEAELQRRREKDPTQDRRGSLLLLNDSMQQQEDTVGSEPKETYLVMALSARHLNFW